MKRRELGSTKHQGHCQAVRGSALRAPYLVMNRAGCGRLRRTGRHFARHRRRVLLSRPGTPCKCGCPPCDRHRGGSTASWMVLAISWVSRSWTCTGDRGVAMRGIVLTRSTLVRALGDVARAETAAGGARRGCKSMPKRPFAVVDRERACLMSASISTAYPLVRNLSDFRTRRGGQPVGGRVLADSGRDLAGRICMAVAWYSCFVPPGWQLGPRVGRPRRPSPVRAREQTELHRHRTRVCAS